MSASGPGPDPAVGLSVRAEPRAARADDIRQLTGNLTIGSRLIASCTAFIFMAFLFGFFYLKAVNSNGLWRPKGVEPVQGWGLAVIVLMILTTLAFDVARRTLIGGRESQWRNGSLAAVGLAVLVIVAQAVEWATISFKTDQGGWASIFWGWTAVELLLWLGAVYWIETLVAQTLRRPIASPLEGTAGNELLRPSADAALVFLYTLVAIGALTYILLYLVK